MEENQGKEKKTLDKEALCERLKSEKVLAENTKIYILLMVSHMGASRFEFSTKFGLTDCVWHLSNIYKRIDFSTVKSTNLLCKIC